MRTATKRKRRRRVTADRTPMITSRCALFSSAEAELSTVGIERKWS